MMKPPILNRATWHSELIWICEGSPVVLSRDVTFTVSPKRQKRGLSKPITPAATGPTITKVRRFSQNSFLNAPSPRCIPIRSRIARCGLWGTLYARMEFRRLRANKAASTVWWFFRGKSPDAYNEKLCETILVKRIYRWKGKRWNNLPQNMCLWRFPLCKRDTLERRNQKCYRYHLITVYAIQTPEKMKVISKQY